MPQIRVIRKYKNRKLYDTTTSRYVTLGEIAQLIKQGVEMQVKNYENDDDLTGIVLTEILYEQEKENDRVVPLSTLMHLIRSKGPSPFAFMQEFIRLTFAGAGEGQTQEATRYLGSLVEHGVLTAAEGASLLKELQQAQDESAGELESQISSRLAKNVTSVSGFNELQDKLDKLNSSIDEFSKNF